MKIAIHQPNYLPWIGFFDKLDQVDIFVLLDTALYSKSGFINRNKIKTPQGDLMLTVPIKTKNKSINETVIDYTSNWQRKHWKSIESNYRNSSFWNKYKDGFEYLYSQKWLTLSELNIAFIQHINYILAINTPTLIVSDFNKDFGVRNERNINIVKHLKGTEYLSGIGARAYNNELEFTKHNIILSYQSFNHPHYPQRFHTFIPNLSIIDMIFNCGPDTLPIIRKQRK